MYADKVIDETVKTLREAMVMIYDMGRTDVLKDMEEHARVIKEDIAVKLRDTVTKEEPTHMRSMPSSSGEVSPNPTYYNPDNGE